MLKELLEEGGSTFKYVALQSVQSAVPLCSSPSSSKFSTSLIPPSPQMKVSAIGSNSLSSEHSESLSRLKTLGSIISSTSSSFRFSAFCLFVVTPFLPEDEGMA